MNAAVFKQAQEAYAQGDYKTALEGFSACAQDTENLSPADLSKFYHLIGNCYVKGGDPYAAATFYQRALSGSPEKRKPSLYVNLGTALLGSKDYENALVAFSRALTYPIYATPYKAYSGIGAAQLKLGNMTEAGAAYREAALDPANPAPAKALVNLGVCFMELGRSADAITSYETALEFDLDDKAKAKALANLGQAYMAEGRVQKAINAFEQAMSGGNYQLSPMASHDYEIAMSLKDRLDSRMPGILDTGFIPNLSAVAGGVEEQATGLEPGDEGFDPFAPKTQAMPTIDAGQVAEEPQKPQERQERKAEDVADKAASVDYAAHSRPEPQPEPDVADEGDEPAWDESDEDADEEAQLDATVAMPAATPVNEDELEQTLEELGLSDNGADMDFSAAETQVMAPVGAGEKTLDIQTGATAPVEAVSDDDDAAAGADDGSAWNAGGADADAGGEQADDADEGDGYFEDYEDVYGDEGEYVDDYNQYDDLAGYADLEASRPMAIVDSGEPLNDLDRTDTHMPNPDQTAFFDLTEKQINQDAREDRKRKRKSRGVGLKVAIVIVILAILVVGAGCAAYMMGYGYPSQEDVTRNFFAAVQNGDDTDQYWAKDVDQTARESQTATLANMTAYNVEGVERSSSQTAVYVKGTLREGGQIEYKTVLARDGLSWAVEYIELYFPSAK